MDKKKEDLVARMERSLKIAEGLVADGPRIDEIVSAPSESVDQKGVAYHDRQVSLAEFFDIDDA